MKKEQEKKITAVIHAGSANVRLKIAEFSENELKVIEELSRSCPIGKDIYLNKSISRETINNCIIIINEYLEYTKTYEIDDVSIIASPTVLEAGNSDIFFDNIRMYTRYDIAALSETDEMQYYYFSQGNKLVKTSKKLKQKKIVRVGLLKIGGGSCLLTVFQSNKIIASHSFRLGSIRINNQYAASNLHGVGRIDYFSTIIKHELLGFKNIFPTLRIDTLHIISDEFETVIDLFCENDTDITLTYLQKAEKKLKDLSKDQIYYNFNVPIEFCDALLPTTVITRHFMKFFNKEHVHVTKSGLLNGFIELRRVHLSLKHITPLTEKQLYEECLHIGRYLSFDLRHARQILKFSLKFFDVLTDIHCLGNRERLYLYTAAMLHDIGTSIALEPHHRHSQYIIEANDFLFFSEHEKKIIGHIARYHRKSLPNKAHREFNALDSQSRMTILKCAAILRLCDALDYSHMQFISEIEINKPDTLCKDPDKTLLINASCSSKPYGEMYSLKIKKDLFEMLFGFTVELKIH